MGAPRPPPCRRKQQRAAASCPVSCSSISRPSTTTSRRRLLGALSGRSGQRSLSSPTRSPAGMIWSGDLPGVETLKENIAAYFNILQGFLLVCHGSTVGAGPTLHKSICSSAKSVVDSSFSLFKQAVSAYESCNPELKLTIPPVTRTVWEGMSCSQEGAYDQLYHHRASYDPDRRLSEGCSSGDDAVENSSDGAVDTSCSDRDELASDVELDDDFIGEEVTIARLIITVAPD